MIELPQCRWRGGPTEPGRHECASPKLVVGPRGVPDAGCEECYCRDHGGVPPARQSAPGPCRHLGGHTHDASCPSCRGRVRLKVHACAVHGACTLGKRADGVKGCCAGCPEYDPEGGPCPPAAAARADDPPCGVVVGIYQWPRLAELQVRTIRASCGPVPILLSDDHSPDDRWAVLERVAERYPDVLVRRNAARIGHAGGDLSAYHRGLLWAKGRGLAVLAKLSQRFLCENPHWLQEGAKALLESGKAAAGRPCREGKTRFAVRSEAVLMDVARMTCRAALNHLAPRPIRSAAEPMVNAAIQVSGGMHPWGMIQENRFIRDRGVWWHCSASDADYRRLAGRYGVALDADFTAGGVHKMPWYQWG